MEIKEIIELVKEIEPSLFVGDLGVAEGRIQAVVDNYSNNKIYAEGVVALMKKSRRGASSVK